MHQNNLHFVSFNFCFILHRQWILINVGLDHDKIILLSTPFPTYQCCVQIVLVMLFCSMVEINIVLLYGNATRVDARYIVPCGNVSVTTGRSNEHCDHYEDASMHKVTPVSLQTVYFNIRRSARLHNK